MRDWEKERKTNGCLCCLHASRSGKTCKRQIAVSEDILKDIEAGKGDYYCWHFAKLVHVDEGRICEKWRPEWLPYPVPTDIKDAWQKHAQI